MKRFLTFTFTIVAASLSMMSQLTLDRCLELADENYPLIKKYDIVAKTMDISLSDINKGWLPKISIYGQSRTLSLNFPQPLPECLINTDKTSRAWDMHSTESAST